MARRERQVAAAMGAVGIILLFGALIVPETPPKTSDSVGHLTRAFSDHRHAILVASYVGGLGALAFLWFLGALREFLRTGAEERGLATTAIAGGVLGVGAILGGIAVATGLVLVSLRMPDPALVRAFTDASNAFIELGKFGMAAVVLATTVAAWRGGLLAAPMIRLGAVAGTLLVISALPPFLAVRGVGQFGGAIDVGGSVPATIWFIFLSLVIARRFGAAAQAEPARAPMAVRG
jgi:hypothetical protein